ncbi:hypothetical protein ACJVDH_19640 [Pedobacter sp. AW1-32]|uniref:hypothetical protein n=1 Tax=Pedobacter sp. AW1-32 TaxID=3383026 RepID=UPI003FEDCF96
MLKDYQELVLETYKRKRDNGELSNDLKSPTVARLRDETLKVFNKRYNDQDHDILFEFFDIQSLDPNLQRIISQSGEREFRPLLNHVKEITTSTDEKNTELLAFLIDFQPRPSFKYYKILREQNGKQKTEEANEGIGQEETTKEIPEDGKEFDKDDNAPFGKNISDTSASTKAKDEARKNDQKNNTDDKNIRPKPLRSISTILIASLILLGFARIAFISYNYLNNTPSDPQPNQKCMYWTGNHYEPIDCNRKVGTAPVVPLNLKALYSFKRITLPDTLTHADLGKVWYAKADKLPLFFTGNGINPMDTAKRLMPLSSYIQKTYTSPYRFMLSRIIWIVCSLLVAVGLGILLEYYWRKVKCQKILNHDKRNRIDAAKDDVVKENAIRPETVYHQKEKQSSV